VKVLAIGAHPSDLVHLCGGTLARYALGGNQVAMAVLCIGNSAFPAFPPELESARAGEFRQSASVIGAEAHWLALWDFAVRDEPHCRFRLVELMRQVVPDVILTHCPDDYCTDHAVIGELGSECMMMARQPGIRTDSPPIPLQPDVIHMDTVSGLGFAPQEFVDITEVMETKRSMLQRFEMELEMHGGDPVVAPLEWAEITSRFRGLQCGVRYAEAFRRSQKWGRMAARRSLP